MKRCLLAMLIAVLLGCSPRPVDFSRAGEGPVQGPSRPRTVADMRDGETACLFVFWHDGKAFVYPDNKLGERLPFFFGRGCIGATITRRGDKYAVRASRSHLIDSEPRAGAIPVLVEGAAAERKP